MGKNKKKLTLMKTAVEVAMRELFEEALSNVEYKLEGGVFAYMCPDALEPFSKIINEHAGDIYMGAFKDIPKVH